MAGLSDSRRWLSANGRRACVCWLTVFAAVALGGSMAESGSAQGEGIAYSVELKGEINPTRKSQLKRALEDAKKKRARLVIVRLNTPGGEVENTRAMIDALLAVKLPVVVYVAPDGARAGSAGVFITMASDVAAMATQTNIGSASPILVGPRGPAKVPRVLYRKVLNDSAAYVRALAEGHGRNADLAERMVRKATNVTASRARRERLVDLVAGSEGELLKRLDGFRVKGRKAQVLRTAGLRIVRFSSPSEADPNPPGDGTVAFGLGVPGLIAVGMLATLVAALIAQVFGWGAEPRPRR